MEIDVSLKETIVRSTERKRSSRFVLRQVRRVSGVTNVRQVKAHLGRLEFARIYQSLPERRGTRISDTLERQPEYPGRRPVDNTAVELRDTGERLVGYSVWPQGDSVPEKGPCSVARAVLEGYGLRGRVEGGGLCRVELGCSAGALQTFRGREPEIC